jgi:phage regulator Rha-like protein
MEKLVELYQGKEARVSTFKIWSKFGYKEHRQFRKVVEKNINNFERYGHLFTASTDAANRKKGGQEKGYLLNEEQFTLLIMLAKNTPETIDLKMRVVDQFFRMRKQLAQLASMKSSEDYLKTRSDGKTVYFQKTDVIKKFVDYATAQGSQSANRYYTNIAMMENKALFILDQKYPNVREVLNIKQLMQVATADQVVERAIDEGMNKEMNYKDIYQLAKERVIMFSNIIGTSLVIDMQNKMLSQDSS